MSNVLPNEVIYRFLDTTGEGTGNKSGTGNYESAMQEFCILNTSRQIQIRTLVVLIRDSGLFTLEKYGAMPTLGAGIQVKVKDNNLATQLDLTDGEPIRSYASWSSRSFARSQLPEGSGDGFVNVRWNFKDSGSDIVLPAGWRLSVELNDNFEDLVEHAFFVHGRFTPGG